MGPNVYLNRQRILFSLKIVMNFDISTCKEKKGRNIKPLMTPVRRNSKKRSKVERSRKRNLLSLLQMDVLLNRVHTLNIISLIKMKEEKNGNIKRIQTKQTRLVFIELLPFRTTNPT